WLTLGELKQAPDMIRPGEIKSRPGDQSAAKIDPQRDVERLPTKAVSEINIRLQQALGSRGELLEQLAALDDMQRVFVNAPGDRLQIVHGVNMRNATPDRLADGWHVPTSLNESFAVNAVIGKPRPRRCGGRLINRHLLGLDLDLVRSLLRDACNRVFFDA